MNRYFFRLPTCTTLSPNHRGEGYSSRSILVVTSTLEYYWERRGEQSTNGPCNGVLTPGDEAFLTRGGAYLELRPDSDRDFILNRMDVSEHTEANWREALTHYAVAASPSPKLPDPRLKTNHKLGAPKGKLP